MSGGGGYGAAFGSGVPRTASWAFGGRWPCRGGTMRYRWVRRGGSLPLPVDLLRRAARLVGRGPLVGSVGGTGPAVPKGAATGVAGLGGGLGLLWRRRGGRVGTGPFWALRFRLVFLIRRGP